MRAREVGPLLVALAVVLLCCAVLAALLPKHEPAPAPVPRVEQQQPRAAGHHPLRAAWPYTYAPKGIRS